MPKQPSPIAKTAGKSRGKRVELARWIEERQPIQIGEAEFEELRRKLSPVSESYLRRLLRDSGVPLAAMVEGVRQSGFDELEASLVALLDEYEKREPEQRGDIRRLVINAKDHARWAARDDKREVKEEMILWMLTWLENPPVFREWVKLRRAQIG